MNEHENRTALRWGMLNEAQMIALLGTLCIINWEKGYRPAICTRSDANPKGRTYGEST